MIGQALASQPEASRVSVSPLTKPIQDARQSAHVGAGDANERRGGEVTGGREARRERRSLGPLMVPGCEALADL